MPAPTDPIEQLDNGVAVFQTTDEDAPKHNIYCEEGYALPDSSAFVYERTNPDRAPNSAEYVLCEFGTWKKRVLGHGQTYPTLTERGRLYSYRDAGEMMEIARLAPAGEGASAKEEVVAARPKLPRNGCITISPDERYVACGWTLSYQPPRFVIELFDIEKGERRVICEQVDICNPHPQFERGQGRQILIQHNRGCEHTPDGTLVRLVGEQGATLFLLDIEGNITRLQVGAPYTKPCTGHETWIGKTGEVILTVDAFGDFGAEHGNILGVRAGEAHRVIAKGHAMNHIGAPPCGRYFSADGNKPDEIIVGSTVTGKTAVVAPARSTYEKFGQASHPHAYLSPDGRWMVFNSDRTGRPEVYAASIPAELLAGLD